MARNLSLYRRRLGLVDVIFPARAGAKSYEFFASSNWDVAGASFQIVPANGYRSPSVPDVGMADSQFRDKTRFSFSPADYASTFFLSSLISLTNQLKLRYNAHAANGGGVWHTAADGVNVVAVADATNEATAIALLNDIRAKYEAHRVRIAGATHATADTANVTAAPVAADFATAVALANDLKAKFNAHRTANINVPPPTQVHAINDTFNIVMASADSLDDSRPFYLSIQQTGWDGVVGPLEAQHLVLPYSSAPNRPVVLRGTAPAGASISDSVEVQLPAQCQNAVMQSMSAASYIAFEPGGPEFRVPDLVAESLDLTLVYPSITQLFIRGDGAPTTFQFVSELRNNRP